MFRSRRRIIPVKFPNIPGSLRIIRISMRMGRKLVRMVPKSSQEAWNRIGVAGECC